MTDEVQVLAPDAATNASDPEATSTVETVDESQTAIEAESGSAEPGESGDEVEEDKLQAAIDQATRKARRRIERLIADRGAAQQRAAQLEAELTEARKAGTDQPVPSEDPREIARQMRIVEKTAEATAKVMKDAGARFPDFESAVAELVEEIGPQIDRNGRPSTLMEAVLDSDRASEVLYHLGKNPDIAAEIAHLSPIRIGKRIAQIESDLAAQAKPKPSAAAKPLTPVKAQAVPTVDPAKLTDAQWRAERIKARMGS